MTAQGPDLPSDLRYNEEHQWVKNEQGVARLGITHYGQDRLSDIVFVAFPSVGAKLNAGDHLLDIESTKVMWELTVPLSGEVVEVNGALDSTPELVNQDPYGRGWLLRMRLDDESGLEEMLDAAAYAAFLETQPQD